MANPSKVVEWITGAIVIVISDVALVVSAYVEYPSILNPASIFNGLILMPQTYFGPIYLIVAVSLTALCFFGGRIMKGLPFRAFSLLAMAIWLMLDLGLKNGWGGLTIADVYVQIEAWTLFGMLAAMTLSPSLKI
ncbi:MAG: hypothetical protein ACLPY5_08580 [Candidatus Bathyarchaeia archaeon]